MMGGAQHICRGCKMKTAACVRRTMGRSCLAEVLLVWSSGFGICDAGLNVFNV
jgi:hypothetical protein